MAPELLLRLGETLEDLLEELLEELVELLRTLRSLLELPGRLFQILVPFFRGSTGLIRPASLLPLVGLTVVLLLGAGRLVP